MTPEGKQRSRCNAVRHGLTAETVIASLEDAEDYEAFQTAVMSDYDAETAVERELVLRLASVLWRLRRAAGIEAALFEGVAAESGKSDRDYPDPTPLGQAPLSQQNLVLLGAARQSDAAEVNEPSLDANKVIGDCFLRLAALPTFPLDRLSRYEYLLWRQARQPVFTLECLQRSKRERRRPASTAFPQCNRRAFSEEFK